MRPESCAYRASVALHHRYLSVADDRMNPMSPDRVMTTRYSNNRAGLGLRVPDKWKWRPLRAFRTRGGQLTDRLGPSPRLESARWKDR
jgi:hypothetical protein